MLSSLLAQFRQRFPEGSLTTELLTIHDGQYVVQVCVALAGNPLACALGADPRVEAAEDRATSRALDRLGLVEEPATAPAAIAPADRLNSSTAALSADLAEALGERPSGKVVALPPSPEMAMPAIPKSPEPSRLEPLPPRPQPMAPLLSEPPLPMPEPPLAASQRPEPTVTTDDLADDLGQTHGGPVIPVDLSDIIAQTDVELQRLGWGVNQGREFLEKTYGKRSRHDLTDDELLEFLLYLETQSAPSPPAAT